MRLTTMADAYRSQMQDPAFSELSFEDRFGCALGVAACRNLYTVKYIRLPDLLNELAVARGEGCHTKVIKQYKKG